MSIYHTFRRVKANHQVFELITGDYLFDPQSGTKYGKDDDHTAQIIELLGPFPKSLCLSCKWSQEIFNRKGELRNIHRLCHWALPDVLKEKYHFKEEDAKKIAEFLTPLLELPLKREPTPVVWLAAHGSKKYQG
jgi:serine/threonine-protein kinase SRPK3